MNTNYTLVTLDLPRPMGVELELINREEWGATPLPVGHRIFSNNVIHVLIHHTATENCFNLTACKMFVYNYQVCSNGLIDIRKSFDYEKCHNFF